MEDIRPANVDDGPPTKPPPPVEPSPQDETRNELVIPPQDFSVLPLLVRRKLKESSVQDQLAFLDEFRRKKKSVVLAYLLWLFGFHYAYFGKWGLLILFLLTGWGFFVWWVVDAFRIQAMVDDANKDIATEVYRGLVAMDMC